MASLASLLINVGVKLDGSLKVEQGLRSLRSSAKDTGSRFAQLGATIGKRLTYAATAVATASTAAAAALGALVLKTAASADTINKLATSLGVGVEELQRLQFAAGQSGLGDEKLSAGIKKLNTSVLDLESGGGAAKATFAELGLGLSDLKGRSASEQLGLIGDRLNEVQSDAERSAMAAKLFGEEAGPAMASLLAAGSQGLSDLMAQTKGVFSQEDADRASAFQDRLGELTNFVEGLATTVAMDLLPPILGVAESIKAWVIENEAIIGQGIEVTLQVITDILHTLWNEGSIVIDIVKGLAKWIAGASKDTSTWSEILDGLLWVIRQMLSPLQNLRTLAGEVAYLLSELGIISMQTADEFNKSIGLIESSSSGLDRTAEKYRNLTRAADEARLAAQMQRQGKILYGENFAGPLSPADQEKAKKEMERLRAERAKSRTSSRAAAATPKGPKEKKEKKKEKTSALSWTDAFDVFLGSGGDLGGLEAKLQDLAMGSPSTHDIAPTVAMDVTINNFTNTQNITAPSPAAAGDQAAMAIQRVLNEAATSLPSKVKR